MTTRGEFELIDAIRRCVGPPPADVIAGIGDDCAVLRGDAEHDLLLTTDLLLEGRHFTLDAAPEDIGWKSLAVNVSDVAAMGGRSEHAVLAVALRPELSGDFADRFLAGFVRCAQRYGVALVGGDTNATNGPIVVSVALTGRVRRGAAVLRSGARPGDAICVTGALGGSLRERHLRAMPRQDEAAALVEGGAVHAMIDLSDGLSSDLGHVLDASRVGAELWADAIPVHADALAAAVDGRSPLAHAFDDGEDFELCFTVPADRATTLVHTGVAGTPVAWIGRVTTAREYVLLDRRDPHPVPQPVRRGGFDHFSAA